MVLSYLYPPPLLCEHPPCASTDGSAYGCHKSSFVFSKFPGLKIHSIPIPSPHGFLWGGWCHMGVVLKRGQTTTSGACRGLLVDGSAKAALDVVLIGPNFFLFTSLQALTF